MAMTSGRVVRRLTAEGSRLYALTRSLLPISGRYYCNACDRAVAAFYRFGPYNLRCPRCGAFERERFVLAAIQAGLLQIRGGERPRLLHVAPSELAFARLARDRCDYVAGDLEPRKYGRDAVHVDLTAMDGLGLFAYVFASHMLEHVPDDLRALREVNAHLVPNGEVWLQVPIIGSETVEGEPSMGPREREARFGGSDHLRAYGPDVVVRLEGAGFQARVVSTDQIDEAVCRRLGLLPDAVYVGVKPHAAH